MPIKLQCHATAYLSECLKWKTIPYVDEQVKQLQHSNTVESELGQLICKTGVIC